MDDYIPAFAGPTGRDAPRLAASVSLAYVGAIATKIAESSPENQLIQSLCEVISSIGEDVSSESFALGWRPEFGCALEFLRVGKHDAALASFLSGFWHIAPNETWDIRFKAPVTILATGRRVDAVLGMAAQDGELKIITVSGLSSRRWGISSLYSLECLPPEAGSGDVAWPLNRILAHEIRSDRLQEGLSFLQSVSVPYHDWVCNILKGVAVFKAPESQIGHASMSSTLYPGLVSYSLPADDASIAEALVHECSHQYFDLLNYVFPLTSNDYDEQLYSSLTKTERPTGRVLLAYHAAVNIAEMYKQAVLCGHHDLMSRYQEMNENALNMERQLRAATILTQLGGVFFNTLLETSAAMQNGAMDFESV